MVVWSGTPPAGAEHLIDPAVRDRIRRILGTINRTSESSGFLRDLFVRDADRHDAMLNYESHVIAANQQLMRAGREPLYLIYPVEGLGIADFPLSFVSGDDPEKERWGKTPRLSCRPCATRQQTLGGASCLLFGGGESLGTLRHAVAGLQQRPRDLHESRRLGGITGARRTREISHRATGTCGRVSS